MNSNPPCMNSPPHLLNSFFFFHPKHVFFSFKTIRGFSQPNPQTNPRFFALSYAKSQVFLASGHLLFEGSRPESRGRGLRDELSQRIPSQNHLRAPPPVTDAENTLETSKFRRTHHLFHILEIRFALFGGY